MAHENGITRRGMLEGAGVMAGSAALAGGFAQKAQAELCDGVQDEKAVSLEDQLWPDSANIPPEEPPAAWDVEADVVVVGAGGGGLAAGVYCAQKGLNVITVEKATAVGGSTVGASIFQVPGGSRFQVENGFAFDPDAIFETWASLLDNCFDTDLLRAEIEHGYEVIDWLEDLGVKWGFDHQFVPGTGGGLIWENADDGGNVAYETQIVVDYVYEQAQQFDNLEYRFSTEALTLVQDPETKEVQGVKVEGDEGVYYIKAAKGVVLASGGCSANRDMLRRYAPACANSTGTMATPYSRGDGIRMGFGAGAALAGFEGFAGTEGGVEGDDWVVCLYEGYISIARKPWLAINKMGNRYPYQSFQGPAGTFAPLNMSRCIQGQQGNRGYEIFDADFESHIETFGQNGCRRPLTPDMPGLERVGEHFRDWHIGFEAGVENGIVKKADTIEELADQLGLRREVLTKAVEDWNAVCEAGEDDPKYGYDNEWLFPIQNPPYYGIKTGLLLMDTSVGVQVNTSMNVIDNDGCVIPGLYATFHVAGGDTGYCTNGMTSPLGACALSWWGGYTAAKTICGD